MIKKKSKKKKLILEYIGMNAALCPVYQDQHGKLWIDTGMESDTPCLFSAANNEMDGEPMYPIEESYSFSDRGPLETDPFADPLTRIFSRIIARIRAKFPDLDEYVVTSSCIVVMSAIAITVCYFLCLKFGDVIAWIIVAVCFLYLLFMVIRFLKLLKEDEDDSEDTVGPFGNNEGEKK